MLSFSVLIKLGLWQLERAEYKRDLMTQLAARQSQPLSWPFAEKSAEQLIGHAFSARVQIVSDHAVLLDNQSHQGQVGYRYLQPAKVLLEPERVATIEQADPTWLLLDLGFIAVARGDRTLPSLPKLPTELSLSGRLFRFGVNPLNRALQPEPFGSLVRAQAVNLTELSAYWQQTIAPVLLMVEQPTIDGAIPIWQPINLQPEKHQGYALQWFGLAVALLVISVIALWPKPQQPTLQ